MASIKWVESRYSGFWPFIVQSRIITRLWCHMWYKRQIFITTITLLYVKNNKIWLLKVELWLDFKPKMTIKVSYNSQIIHVIFRDSTRLLTRPRGIRLRFIKFLTRAHLALDVMNQRLASFAKVQSVPRFTQVWCAS